MSAEYSYRLDNHYEFPTCPLEVIDDHLKFYPESVESRRAIIGLRNLYAKTPLLELIQEYSRFMKIAKIEAKSEQEPIKSTTHDAYFLSGSVIALHCLIYPAPKHLQIQLLNENPVSGFREMPDSEKKKELLLSTVAAMAEWTDSGVKTSFDAQSEIFQEKLLELTENVSGGVNDAADIEEDFISGFLFTVELIQAFGRGKLKTL